MAGDEPIDVGALFPIWQAQHPVTLEANISDIDVQVNAVRKLCEDFATRIAGLEAQVAAFQSVIDSTAANLDALSRRMTLTSGVSLGNAIQQILNYVQVIAKDTDGNPNN